MAKTSAVCRRLLSVPRSRQRSPRASLLLQARKGSCSWYHSEHHPDPPPFPSAQTDILSAALNRVPEYGFSSQALSLGAKDAGYLEVSVQLFPRGVYDLIDFHLVTQRLALKDRVQFPTDAKLGVGKKVRVLTLERLKANKDVIHQWQGVGRAWPALSFQYYLSLTTSLIGTRSHVLIGKHTSFSEGAQCPLRRDLVSCRRHQRRYVLVYQTSIPCSGVR
jgi:hypothetical protein